MNIRLENIPNSLKGQLNWIRFRLSWNEEKMKYGKDPFQVAVNRRAKSNDAATCAGCVSGHEARRTGSAADPEKSDGPLQHTN